MKRLEGRSGRERIWLASGTLFASALMLLSLLATPGLLSQPEGGPAERPTLPSFSLSAAPPPNPVEAPGAAPAAAAPSVPIAAAIGNVSIVPAFNPVDAQQVDDGFQAVYSGGVCPCSTNWSFGDGSPASGWQATNNTSHAFRLAGNYTVGVQVRDSVGNVSTAALVVQVVPSGFAQIVTDPFGSQGDVGFPMHFGVDTYGGQTPYTFVNWNFTSFPGNNATTNVSGADHTHTYGVAGTYWVTMNWSDAGGGGYQSKFWSPPSELQVYVNPLPSVRIYPSGNPTDVGSQILFYAFTSNGTGPFNFSWSFGDGSAANSSSALHAWATPGNYTVTVWANDSLGASSSSSVVMDVGPALTVTLGSSNRTPLIGASILLTATAHGGAAPYTYSWTGLPPGCVSTNSPTLGCLPTQAGNYTVIVTAGDARSGEAQQTLNLSVIFDFTVVSPGSLTLGASLHIAVNAPASAGPFTYAYSALPPGCQSVDAPTLTCTPSDTGTYRIGISVTDATAHVAHHTVAVTIARPGALLGPLSSLPLIGLVLGLAVVAIAVALLVRRRGTRAAGWERPPKDADPIPEYRAAAPVPAGSGPEAAAEPAPPDTLDDLR